MATQEKNELTGACKELIDRIPKKEKEEYDNIWKSKKIGDHKEDVEKSIENVSDIIDDIPEDAKLLYQELLEQKAILDDKSKGMVSKVSAIKRMRDIQKKMKKIQKREKNNG